MRISMIHSGGFTGRRLVASADGDDLPAEFAAVVARLVAEPPPPAGTAPSGAGQPQYALTVQDRGQVRQIVLTESAVPADVRPLLQELIRRA
ncbi:MAG: hypothetical protein JWL64_1623, partial [Frankiales bacterium]|nr:hypothetical protein [Frankiales bacterium]